MSFYAFLDALIIQMYRLTGYVVIDYFIGTFLLALLTVVVGEWTLSLTLRFNRSHLNKIEGEMNTQHELSLAALRENDKKRYKLFNKEANDAFGRYFFNMIACSAAALWPVPFALSWMQGRFSGVVFEFAFPVSLLWRSTGYFTTFLLCYILARILFKNVRRYLPYFRKVQQELDRCCEDSPGGKAAVPGAR